MNKECFNGTQEIQIISSVFCFFHLFLRSVATSLEQKVCDGVKGYIGSPARTSPAVEVEVNGRSEPDQ